MPSKRHPDEYVLWTGHPGFVVLNMVGDKAYAALKEQEKNRTLTSNHPTIMPKAALKQTYEMLYDEVYDEEKLKNIREFKEDVVAARADSKGRMYIKKGKEELLKRIIRSFANQGVTVKFDEEGLDPPTETVEEIAKHKGGRGRRKTEPMTEVGK